MDDDLTVGTRLRNLRRERGLSQKELAELANLALNSVSLIERGEISPNVATLQRLASALRVKMSYFFETGEHASVIHARAAHRPAITSSGMKIEGLSTSLEAQQMQPFVLTLKPGADTQGGPVTHAGQEFVYCLRGTLRYVVDGVPYLLEQGDVLLFEATRSHYCENPGGEEAQFLLVLQSPNALQELTRRHFSTAPSVTYIS